jgi:hypothetical protein
MEVPGNFAFRWALLRWRKGEPEQLLAEGHASTLAAAREAIVEKAFPVVWLPDEKAFPVAWLPEVYYVVRNAEGFEQETGSVTWLPVTNAAWPPVGTKRKG